MKRDKASDVEVEILPGISAFQKGAALLGAPIGHDFCIISLSDLMTPWEKIERRIEAAASADFVTAVYNPKSEGRYWELYRLKELFSNTANRKPLLGTSAKPDVKNKKLRSRHYMISTRKRSICSRS